MTNQISAASRRMGRNKANKQQQKNKHTSGDAVVIMQVLEEPPPRPSRVARQCPPTDERTSKSSTRPRSAALPPPPPIGYDRKQLLLAYSRQLRQLHAQQNQSAPGSRSSDSRSAWGEWKAAHCGVNAPGEVEAAHKENSTAPLVSTNSGQKKAAAWRALLRRCRDGR